MSKELNRVESAISATASGNLTDGKWPYDVSTALGMAGRHNPLGFALVRFLSGNTSSVEVWSIILTLSTRLIREQKLETALANKTAWTAFEWWQRRACSVCHGRGFVDAAQRQCQACGGSGHREKPVAPEHVHDAIAHLIEAESWMEGQLAKKLKRGG